MGKRANDVPPAKRGAALVFQSYALFPHMTIQENLAFGLKIRGAGKAERDAKVMGVAKDLELDGLLHRRPGALSGGQRQRVAIGRAMLRDPQVFCSTSPCPTSTQHCGCRPACRSPSCTRTPAAA